MVRDLSGELEEFANKEDMYVFSFPLDPDDVEHQEEDDHEPYRQDER